MRRGELEAELRWFFSQADGEMGLRSNFTGIVARIEGGGGTGVAHHVDTRRLEAAARARRIAAALSSVSKPERTVLFAAYSREPESRLLCVMLHTPEAREAHRKSRSTRSLGVWLERLCAAVKSPHEFERRRTFARIHAAAVRSLEGALDAYSKHARRVLSPRAC